jgi:hypothetical protein
MNVHNRWAIIVSPYGTRLSINISGLSKKVPFSRGKLLISVGHFPSCGNYRELSCQRIRFFS